MNALLEQIGFDSRELAFYKDEMIRLKNILQLSETDINKTARDLGANFDLSFESIRMLLKELFLCVFSDYKMLADKKKKVIQMAIPMPNAIPGVVNELTENVHVSSSEYIMIYLAGIVFDVYHQIGSVGSNRCKRCGLNLARESLYNNPWYLKPDGVMTCFGYCDEIHKTGEMIEIEHDVTHYNLTQIHGIPYAQQKDYLSEVLTQFMTGLTGASENMVLESFKKMNQGNLEINMLLNKVQTLVAKSPHVYVTFNELSLLHIFNLVHFERHHDKGKRILMLFIKELKRKIKTGDFVMEQPLRIGCMHLPFTNAYVDRVFREHNAAVIVSSMYAADPEPLALGSDFDRCLSPFFRYKMLTALPEKQRFIDRIIENGHLDGFLFGQFENDRALGGNQMLVMNSLEYKDKAYYMSVHNWRKMGGNDYVKLESLIEVIKERTTNNDANTKSN